jgi:hypothetical protein
MGVSLDWDNEDKTVIMLEVEWPITWNDLAAAWNSIVEMMKTVSHVVHTIVVSKTSRFPAGNPLSNLRHIMRVEPKNLGLAILVTDNRFQATINTVLFKMSPHLNKYGHVVETLEQAYALVEKEGGNIRPPT